RWSPCAGAADPPASRSVTGPTRRSASRAPRRPSGRRTRPADMATALTSRRHAVGDLADAIEFCHSQGWTDGLPVVPPTAGRVEGIGRGPGDGVAYVAHRAVSITAEKVAINAVMAGCRPEYVPVVVAAVEGIADPRWSYHGPGTSTAGAAVLMIVNGPIAAEL